MKKVIENGGIKFKKKEVIEEDEFEELDIEDSDDDEDNDEDNDDEEDDDEEDDDESEEKNGENKRVYVDITTGGGKGVVELLTKNYNPETDENKNDEDLK